MRNTMTSPAIALVAAALLGATSAQALRIDFNFDASVNQEAMHAYEEAASLWEAQIADEITVTFDTSFESLGAGILGGASSNSVVLSYADVYGALQMDVTSGADAIAAANLQPFDSIAFITNDPLGAATAALGDDLLLTSEGNWATFLDVNTATARALDFTVDANGNPLPLTPDATISFNDALNFDFDPSDGIDADAFDFVGIAAHEIGHALGFTTGVSIIDLLSLPGGTLGGAFDAATLSQFAIFSPLDLYRYSAVSRAICGTGPFGCLDLSTNLDPLAGLITPGDLVVGLNTFDVSYFSIDGGVTNEAFFSGGVFNGEGFQPSHWFADDFGLTPTFGIMDPTAALGQRLSISNLDLLALDVIGYDRVAVPEPGTLLLLGAGLLGMAARRKRRLC